MIYHEGNRTIFPEDKCWNCQNSVYCDRMGQLETLVQIFDEKVQFNIAECDNFIRYELKEANDE